ncbi:MAG TPA: SDR family NAD(P)-dependent oxidoreductase, partial [Solirubrobacteraceae bacterium]|nr:SDR family NAD(P)-dependent oxidoreductase [Solirubrobacteraceae bacterium]
ARGDRVVRLVDGETIDAVAGSVNALVHLAALRSAGGDWRDVLERDLLGLFRLTRELREQLLESARRGGAAVLAATRIGAAFAAAGGPEQAAAGHGLLSGFAKSLAQEWPTVRVRAVALEQAAAAVTAQRLLAELLTDDDDAEIGYRDGRRLRLELSPHAVAAHREALTLDRDCVIVATGGARGITAEAVLALARHCRPTVVLVGRTPLGEEDPRTAGLSDPAAVRKAIMQSRREHGSAVTLAAVERDYRSLIAAREVRDTIARLLRGGARAEYVSCDVGDADLFGALIDHVYATHGRIDGVIHGAGVIEDKLVTEKEAESVRRVVETKIAAAYAMAERLRPEGLRFLAFFGSVAGRFGNRGQADYAAASNELNRLAHDLDRRWDARVVTINWGPWRTTGMVSPELEREFARRGVDLISPPDGARMFVDEILLGGKGEPEVVIAGGRALDGRPASPAPRALALIAPEAELERSADGGVDLEITLDADRHLYLDDHRIDGLPVLPFAVAMELMAQLVVTGWRELDVAELRDVRLLSGVVVEDDVPPRLRLTATPIEGSGESSFEVTIAGCEEPPRTHYRAAVDARPRGAAPVAPPAARAPDALDDLSPFAMDVAEAYERYLFHGPLFQGIVAIEGMDVRGARALLRPSLPSACVRDASAEAWLLDPVLVDCALQIQVIWARIHWDVTPLPTQIASLRRLRPLPAASPHPDSGANLVRVELRIRPDSSSPLCRADHLFSDTRGRPIATLSDVVSPGSRALNRMAGTA